MQEQVPVLIVGAGLSLALLLRQQRIPSLLIERRSDVSWYPRARTLNFRTMEVFRGLGLAAEVRAAGAAMSRMFRKHSMAESSQEEVLNPVALVEHMEEFSPEPLGWYCPQSRLEPLLRAVVKQRGADVRYGTELIAFTQDETGVTARIKDRATGNTSDVRAEYLIAADGAHSRIRETLAIPMQGFGELPESQIFVLYWLCPRDAQRDKESGENGLLGGFEAVFAFVDQKWSGEAQRAAGKLERGARKAVLRRCGDRER